MPVEKVANGDKLRPPAKVDRTQGVQRHGLVPPESTEQAQDAVKLSDAARSAQRGRKVESAGEGRDSTTKDDGSGGYDRRGKRRRRGSGEKDQNVNETA